jgi:hypothetical protein
VQVVVVEYEAMQSEQVDHETVRLSFGTRLRQQRIVADGAAVATCRPFTARTHAVSVTSDGACSITFSGNPVLTDSLLPNVTRDFFVSPQMVLTVETHAATPIHRRSLN